MRELENDGDILHVTMQDAIPHGGWRFVIPKGVMPDGEPFTVAYPEKTSAVLVDWCNRVRGEFSARKNSKAAAARSAANAPKNDSSGQGGAVRRSGGGEVPVPDNLPATEEEMERLLSSTLRAVTAEIEAKSSERDVIDKRIKSLYVQRGKLENALQAYASYGEDDESV